MLQVQNPYSNSIIAVLPENTKNEVDTFLQEAYLLHQNFPLGLDKEKKISILVNLKALVETNFDSLLNIAIQEGGKPKIDSIGELNRAIHGITLAIDFLSKSTSENFPINLTEATKNKTAKLIYEPIGVVVAISAFNHPINLIIHQVITAIAAGCPVLIKPDLRTPLSCVQLVNLIHVAGLPKRWCQLVLCDNETSEFLATDKRVAFLNFIGSAKIGWYLRAKIAPGTRCALEHGGIAPAIITSSVNIEKAIPKIIKGAFYHAGQVCVSTQRLFIPEKIQHEFLSQLVSSTKKVIVGNPTLDNTEVGPIINEQELMRIKSWIDESIQEGGTVLCGGEIIDRTCIEPTIILNPSLESKVSTNEIFGPVLCVYTYTNISEAIQQANNTTYHFQASIFGNDKLENKQLSEQLNASTILINEHTAFRVDWMPFGGRSESGLGIGGISYTINDLLKYKLVIEEN